MHDRSRRVGDEAKGREDNGERDKADEIIQRQPVHGDVIEKSVDEADHETQKAPKPLVSVARPFLSMA